jgi:hypothetical protein
MIMALGVKIVIKEGIMLVQNENLLAVDLGSISRWVTALSISVAVLSMLLVGFTMEN